MDLVVIDYDPFLKYRSGQSDGFGRGAAGGTSVGPERDLRGGQQDDHSPKGFPRQSDGVT
jgi:hypothetical protein